MLASRTTFARSLRYQCHNLTLLRLYSDGSIGSSRGSIQDSFLKRERAKEEYFIRQHEKEQFSHIKEQLKTHQKKLDTLQEKIDKLTNNS
ncbi:hypothetical protein NCAS_0A13790 [Naumovozyma castellii]|uniref:ATPase inhibitor, mitochondrial n=1 Tax=Naumovozyma castellii TaxID=27288 RepID=G0V8Y8_NAUCA|nr:hypothetical protein NCAS_0A13790 [Naumovozyma castellii CBS 4309]CCC67937.1 hypothetical protein NCAS_0A13790 [Naumovozyma castellii CBS 4309]